MANWGGLNNALAAWRRGLNELLPKRSTRSDGARADGNHASTSQHQPDADGTVDAFDEDRNYLASSDPDGNAVEDRIHAALDRDFMADRRAHLIIADRKIRNSEIGDWRIRDYGGSSPHTEHTHRQVHQSLEDDGRAWKFTHTRALLADLEGLDMDEARLRTILREEISKETNQVADEVWGKALTLPDGREVTYGTVLRWLDASTTDTRGRAAEGEAETRRVILEKLAELAALHDGDDPEVPPTPAG